MKRSLRWGGLDTLSQWGLPAAVEPTVEDVRARHFLLYREWISAMKILVLSRHPTSLVDQLFGLGYTEVSWLTAWSNPPSPALDDIQLILVDAVHGVDFDVLIRLRHALPLSILLLVGTSDEQVLIDAYHAGIDDHLDKPLAPSLLRAKLQVWKRWVGQTNLVN